MPTETELELPTPLNHLEIKHAIAHKIGEAVFDALERYGPLYGKSFPKFKVSGTLRLTLDNFGLLTESNHAVAIDEGVVDGEVVDVPVDIPETPPNQLRRETEQAVPTMVQERGRQVEKAVVYKQKRQYTRRAQAN